ncbi:hypothetical protein Mgra_00004887 [Meloidogyne graminicola]|uniref:EF-hand domain-containing protein n=1 Tax=Meloidogyne graminicola TaxID=189291 RepID=A0A8S9ZQY3_9BILA|nr:hypothetical protein Mgra_00004887 [Meloidogyne graminicola]
MDSTSLDDLSSEPPERPPSLEQLQQLTGNRFSLRWLKYTYNRFKNECPTGRMHFTEFKRLFGGFLPDRINDTYLERVFHAFCRTHQEQLSFKDMVVSLSKLCDSSPESNAEWIMRLINKNVNNDNGQISYKEFLEFIKSVFTLRGKSEQNELKKMQGSIRRATTSMAEDCSLISNTSRIENQQKKSLEHHSKPPTTFKTAALLASAVGTPTTSPAIASFVPFVGNSKREISPEHEVTRAINRRAFFLFEVKLKLVQKLEKHTKNIRNIRI